MKKKKPINFINCQINNGVVRETNSRLVRGKQFASENAAYTSLKVVLHREIPTEEEKLSERPLSEGGGRRVSEGGGRRVGEGGGRRFFLFYFFSRQRQISYRVFALFHSLYSISLKVTSITLNC
jgi:hypothetical protein